MVACSDQMVAFDFVITDKEYIDFNGDQLLVLCPLCFAPPRMPSRAAVSPRRYLL